MYIYIYTNYVCVYIYIYMVNPKKLETGLRTNSAGIPYTLLLRIEAIGFPTFGFLLYIVRKGAQSLEDAVRILSNTETRISHAFLLSSLRLARCQMKRHNRWNGRSPVRPEPPIPEPQVQNITLSKH